MSSLVLKGHLVVTLVAYVLTLSFKACEYTKIQFKISLVRPRDDFQGPSQFRGHGCWP